MPKINDYKYPRHTIDQCIDWVKVIYNNDITRYDVLASKLGHKDSSSGAFRMKVTSLKRYGLITREGKSGFNLTEIGNKIASPIPDSNEFEESVEESVLNVDLIRDIHERYPEETIDKSDWHYIAEVVNVDRKTAQENLPKIRRIYNTAQEYISESNKEEKVKKEEKTTQREYDEKEYQELISFGGKGIGGECKIWLSEEIMEKSEKEKKKVVKKLIDGIKLGLDLNENNRNSN